MGKIAVDERFSSLPNHIVKRKDLSWKAKGIFLYLFNQDEPVDELRGLGFRELVEHSADEIDSVLSGLSELEDAGLIDIKSRNVP